MVIPMKFILKKDKNVCGETGVHGFVEAGEYEVIRIFDKNRVLVSLTYGNPRQLTILDLKDGVLSV